MDRQTKLVLSNRMYSTVGTECLYADKAAPRRRRMRVTTLGNTVRSTVTLYAQRSATDVSNKLPPCRRSMKSQSAETTEILRTLHNNHEVRKSKKQKQQQT